MSNSDKYCSKKKTMVNLEEKINLQDLLLMVERLQKPSWILAEMFGGKMLNLHDPKRTELGSFKRGMLESELNGHTVDSSILKEIKKALILPDDSKPVFTLSDYKETGNTANDVYPRSFTVNYSFNLNECSGSGVLKGTIRPRKNIDATIGKGRDLVHCFVFSFDGIKDRI